jgi:hypothetical protein
MAVQETTCGVVMTVGEDSGSYGYGVSDNSFCGVAPALNLRLNFFNNNTLASLERFHIT